MEECLMLFWSNGAWNELELGRLEFPLSKRILPLDLVGISHSAHWLLSWRLSSLLPLLLVTHLWPHTSNLLYSNSTSLCLTQDFHIDYDSGIFFLDVFMAEIRLVIDKMLFVILTFSCGVSIVDFVLPKWYYPAYTQRNPELLVVGTHPYKYIPMSKF